MNKLLAAILLATSLVAQAEIKELTMPLMCGSDQDMALTLSSYKEIPYIISVNKDAGVVYSLWVNAEKGTSSWVVKLVATNSYCMMGAGTQIIIPEDSPLMGNPVGERIKFK